MKVARLAPALLNSMLDFNKRFSIPHFDLVDEDIYIYYNLFGYLKKGGQNLSKILINCKNQCWNCHACEKVFNIEPYNSILDL